MPLLLCGHTEKTAAIMREIMWYLLSIRRNRNNKITEAKAKTAANKLGGVNLFLRHLHLTKNKDYAAIEITFAGVRIICACNYRNHLQYDNYCAACIDLLHRSVSVEFHNERT